MSNPYLDQLVESEERISELKKELSSARAVIEELKAALIVSHPLLFQSRRCPEPDLCLFETAIKRADEWLSKS